MGRVLMIGKTAAWGSILEMTKQPSLGTALLAPNGEGPRKGGLKKAFLILTRLASCGQRASHQSGRKQMKKKKTEMDQMERRIQKGLRRLLEHSHNARYR